MDAAALLIQAERVVSHQAELYFAIADKNSENNSSERSLAHDNQWTNDGAFCRRWKRDPG